MRRLKRSIGQLETVSSESAVRLGELLKIEIEAKEEAAKLQPATLALTKAAEHFQGQAVITVISSINDQSDMLLFGLERLKEKGYSVVMVGACKKSDRSVF